MSSPSFRSSTPGLFEIIAGSALSILLGLVLAALFLIFKEVSSVDQVPKDKKSGVVYFVQGRKDWNSGRRWLLKREAFVQGHSISISEDELNAWIEAIYPPVLPAAPAAKDKEKKDADSPWLQPGTPNVRVAADAVTLGVVCDLNIFGLTTKLVLQSEGHFAKSKGAVVFQPNTIFIGSLPLHRFGIAKGFAFRSLAGLYQFPADLEKAWEKLTDVQVDHNQLALTVEGS